VPASPLSSRRNPLVARFRAAARDDRTVMLLDGEHLVAEALDAGIALDTVALVPDKVPASLGERLRQAVPEERLVPVTASLMDAISPVHTPSGIVALASRPTTSLDTIFPSPALVVMAVEVQDPGNLGAIVRSAEAGGATGLLTTRGTADPFGWKALRGSMGSALRLPIAAVDSIGEAVAHARNAGCRTLATAGHGATSLYDIDLRQPVLVLLGREGQGLPEEALSAADERLRIPMQAPVESLNVAVAAALIVYEARRQRVHDGTRARRHDGATS
jgi:TrmH family RNA methyltransferase